MSSIDKIITTEQDRIRKELLASFNQWPPQETFEEALDRICPGSGAVDVATIKCPHPKELTDAGLVGNEQILGTCHCGAILILRPGSSKPEWYL